MTFHFLSSASLLFVLSSFTDGFSIGTKTARYHCPAMPAAATSSATSTLPLRSSSVSSSQQRHFRGRTHSPSTPCGSQLLMTAGEGENNAGAGAAPTSSSSSSSAATTQAEARSKQLNIACNDVVRTILKQNPGASDVRDLRDRLKEQRDLLVLPGDEMSTLFFENLLLVCNHELHPDVGRLQGEYGRAWKTILHYIEDAGWQLTDPPFTVTG